MRVGVRVGLTWWAEEYQGTVVKVHGDDTVDVLWDRDKSTLKAHTHNTQGLVILEEQRYVN